MKKLSVIFLFSIFFCTGFTQIPTDSLVAWYPFDGDAKDLSGNGYNGIINGATLSSDRFGNNNSAFYFDGVNDTITSELGLYHKMSVSMWYKSSYPNNWYPFMFDYGVLSFTIREYGNHPYWIGYITGRIGFQTLNDSPYIPFIRSTYTPNFNQWHHVVAIYDITQNINKLYIDGVFDKDTIVSIAMNPTSGHTKFGCRSILGGADGSLYYTGYLDDIRIYERTLTESEIISLYNESPNTYINTVGKSSKINIFPNPTTTDKIKIQSKIFIKYILIYNSIGEEIKYVDINTTEYELILPKKVGSYILKIVTKNDTIIEKIIRMDS